ncbi:TetR/AcrR family transcriptional regulator [Williamsia sp.]|uniref:TetR/AcrR family transcriptional regulator n=1 Tax=Williamsia sp. TaxID=1872085 RepID=UPI002F92B2C1
MATANSRKAAGIRRPRGSISAEEIVTGAFEVANKTSLSQLSMASLAKHLDVGVASMYWYFRKKEDLLDAMTELASEEYHAATPSVTADNWQDALRKHFRKMHLTFQDQPVLLELFLLRGRTGQLSPTSIRATANKLNSLITEMVRAGFTSSDALEVYLSLLAHVCGAAMIEHHGVFSGDGGGGPRSDTNSALTAPLFQELSEKGRRIDDVEETVFDFTFEAILAHAQKMISN